MTTTAFDDQFTVGTQTIERIHAPYDPIAILRQNVADLELALKRQTERAETAEAELLAVSDDHCQCYCCRNKRKKASAKLEAFIQRGDV